MRYVQKVQMSFVVHVVMSFLVFKLTAEIERQGKGEYLSRPIRKPRLSVD